VAPKDTHAGTCPACHRIADHYPAGVIECTGQFAIGHVDELTAIARNLETHERKDHPLERIMSVAERDGKLVIETTGTHLARRIGKAIARALHGELELQQPSGEHFVRVLWHRDA
jgi:hypothetical protein